MAKPRRGLPDWVNDWRSDNWKHTVSKRGLPQIRWAERRNITTIVEHCDWIPAVLTGTDDLARFKRSRCAAGHKALWHAEFGGYPSSTFLAKLHPRLPRLRSTFGNDTFTADVPFGALSAEWAKKLGLSQKVVVAVGAFDAHMGAVGGGILL